VSAESVSTVSALISTEALSFRTESQHCRRVLKKALKISELPPSVLKFCKKPIFAQVCLGIRLRERRGNKPPAA
jgi:hypothetical protein